MNKKKAEVDEMISAVVNSLECKTIIRSSMKPKKHPVAGVNNNNNN